MYAPTVEVEARTAVARRRFRKLLAAGAVLRPAGSAKKDPDVLLRKYMPKCAIDLFDATYFLSEYLYDESLGFFAGFFVPGGGGSGPQSIYPRIFYKDSSLIWRAGSHYIRDPDGYWVGKGDTVDHRVGEHEYVSSVEETTNLPYELQGACDHCSRSHAKRRDDDAIDLILRRAPAHRIAPYADFTKPRRENTVVINGGRNVARFTRKGDPTSLRFAKGFEPDLDHGLVERWTTVSNFFGGEVRKFRVLSSNRKVQYMFFASPTHAWLNPPQALTEELSTYGVRLVDVPADDDAFVPGFEYHEEDDDGTVTHTQIPLGFAGDPHPENEHRADASAWVEQLPIIKDFRRKLL